MESKDFKYNPKVVKAKLKTVKNTVIAEDELRVMFPSRYINIGVAELGSTVKVISYIAIIDNNNNYAVMLAPIQLMLLPESVSTDYVDGVSYEILKFSKGHVFMPNTKLPQNGGLIYPIFLEFYNKGNVPWYISYEALSKVLLETKKYASSSIGDNTLAYEILVSVSTRYSKDKTKYYRTVVKKKNENIPYTYVGLNNVYYSYDNTGSKLIGGYYGVGVTASIVNKEKKSTIVSDLLRT